MKKLAIALAPATAIFLSGWSIGPTIAQQTGFDFPLIIPGSQVQFEGVGNTNRILYWTADGGEWKDPFEFSTASSSRDVSFPGNVSTNFFVIGPTAITYLDPDHNVPGQVSIYWLIDAEATLQVATDGGSAANCYVYFLSYGQNKGGIYQRSALTRVLGSPSSTNTVTVTLSDTIRVDGNLNVNIPALSGSNWPASAGIYHNPVSSSATRCVLKAGSTISLAIREWM